jgi:hypothetical protein
MVYRVFGSKAAGIVDVEVGVGGSERSASYWKNMGW